MKDQALQITTRTPKQAAEALRRLRKLKKLSQEEVGDRVGLTQTTVSKIEKEFISPSLTTFFKLLTALELELVIRPRQKSKGK